MLTRTGNESTVEAQHDLDSWQSRSVHDESPARKQGSDISKGKMCSGKENLSGQPVGRLRETTPPGDA